MIDESQNAVTPEALKESLTTMAVESWRLTKMFIRMLNKVDAGEQKHYLGKLNWFAKRIEDSLAQAGMRIVNIEGHPFDPGLAATALNIEDFSADDSLIVDQMLEPIIMSQEGLVRTGTITLKKRPL